MALDRNRQRMPRAAHATENEQQLKRIGILSKTEESFQRLLDLLPPNLQPKYRTRVRTPFYWLHLRQLCKFAPRLVTIPFQQWPQPLLDFTALIARHILAVQHEILPLVRCE